MTQNIRTQIATLRNYIDLLEVESTVTGPHSKEFERLLDEAIYQINTLKKH